MGGAKMSKRYYLYSRKRKGKPAVWYARFRSDDGTIGSPVCTQQINESKAEQWAVEALLQGEILSIRKPRAPTFEEWSTPWWIHGKCPYITEKIANGYNISRKYAEVRRSYLTNHLIPEFGKYRITHLKPRQFRDFKMRLYNERKLSPATINRILGTARVRFNYAVEMGDLESNPVAPVKELKEIPRERGVLVMEELRKLFGPGSLEKVWQGDLRHYGANLLAASSGLRLGEVQGLQRQYVFPGYIKVVHGWDDRYGLSAPKWNSVRAVPIPRKTAEALTALMAVPRWGEPEPEDIVFWSRDRQTPLSKTAILKQFKQALKRIGIKETERKERILLFHSYRHGFNTLIRGKIPDEQLRRVTGHKTLTMSDNYDHAGAEHLQDVLVAQEGLFTL